jgi:hypothetical protein
MGLNTATSEEDARLETTLVPVSHAFATLRTDLSPAPSIAAMAYLLDGFEAQLLQVTSAQTA